MKGRIAILHYASPPTIGGVESIIEYQARGLADLGYLVRVISGAGHAFDPRIEHYIDPLFGSSHPDVLAAKSQLDVGNVSPAFYSLVEKITPRLQAVLSDCQIIIAHNIPSLHKNLAFTGALKFLSNSFHFIAWCNDLAWTNPQYLSELHPGEPWDWLRTVWPGVQYVTISESRRIELANLLGISPDSINVIPPGIDPARFFRWTEPVAILEKRFDLLSADGLLLLPARLTRRKNIGFALYILAQLRLFSGHDFRLIVTGPPGPHNPSNPGYLGELLELRQALNLVDCVHFLYTDGSEASPFIPDDAIIADLYRVVDALLFPSLQEGFGIPILEAGLAGLPIFCADIPPLRATGGVDVTYFDPIHDTPETIAASILHTLDANSIARVRRRVRREFQWKSLIQNQLVPLLERE